MSTRFVLGLIGALVVGCGSDSGSNGSSGNTSTSTGMCVGKGWRGTCHWLMTCGKGRYELFCEPPSDPELEQAVADADIMLDGSSCACVIDEQDAQAVPFDDSFCSSNFDSTDPDRQDKAQVLVNGICGWTTP